MQFGNDIVFTWGPLSFLTMCLNIYESKALTILFHFFNASNVVFMVYYIFNALKKNEILILTFLIFIIYGNILFEKVPICFLFISIFHFFYFIKTKKIISIWIITIYVILTFFIKVDFSFIILFYSISFLIFNLVFFKTKRLSHLIAFFTSILAILLCQKALNVDLLNYVKNSMFMINYYNDAMLIIPNVYFQVIFSFLSFLSLFFFLLYLIIKNRKIKQEWFLFLSIFLFVFLAMKYGQLRLDHNHYKIYLMFLVFSFILYIIFTNLPRKRLFQFFIPISFLSLAMQEKNIIKEKEKKFRPATFNTFDPSSQILPPKIISKIGNKSVDFLGSNVSYIFYNKLDYNPRPVFQSYSAYSKELIDLNVKKYSSIDAPDYIIQEYEAPDKIIPNSYEPKTQLEALKNYVLDDSVIFDNVNKSLLLLKRSKNQKKLETTILLDTVVNFEDIIKIPKSKNLIYIELDYNYTLLGKLRRLFFQPSQAQIKMNEKKFYLIKPVAKSGIVVNHLFNSFNDLSNYYKLQWSKAPTVNTISILGNATWIYNNIKVKLIEQKLS